MTPSELFQAALVAFIVLSILYHVWRSGQANPETTGALGKQIGEMSRVVGAVTSAASRAEERLAANEARVAEIERGALRRSDIKHIEEEVDEHGSQLTQLRDGLNQMRVDNAEVRTNVAHTRAQVDRLLDFFVERGVGK